MASISSQRAHKRVSEISLSQHPWFAAILLGTVATPAGVVFAWLAPRPLDAVVALPLVLMDVWAATRGAETASNQASAMRLLLLVFGIVLTWVFYVLTARLLLWRLFLRSGDEVKSE